MVVPFFAGFFVVMVLLLGNVVFNNISIIVMKIAQWRQILYFIFLQTPQFVLLALPSGALFGCSLAISRLARDSEITVLRMAGVKVTRVFLPVFVVGAVVSLTAYAFQEKVTVWAEKESVATLKRIWLSPGQPPIEMNKFFKLDQYYFYVNTVEGQGKRMRLKDIMIYEIPAANGFPTLTTAKTAHQENNVWTLRSGSIFRLNTDGDPEMVGHFDKMILDLRRSISDYLASEQGSPKGLTLFQLREQVSALGKTGQNTRALQLEYAFKLAIPLSSLVLMLSVAPLSLRFGKGGGFMGVLIGIAVLFLYWNVILFSRVLGESGGLNPMLAGWSEVVVFTALGVYLLWKVEHI